MRQSFYSLSPARDYIEQLLGLQFFTRSLEKRAGKNTPNREAVRLLVHQPSSLPHKKSAYTQIGVPAERFRRRGGYETYPQRDY